MDRIVDYDRNAKLFDHRHGDILSESDVEQLIQAASLVPPGRILDTGAGTGRTSIPFSERGFRVFAIDHSVGMLRRVQEKDRTEHVVRIRGDVIRLPIIDDAIDVVVISRILYLVPHWSTLLREAIPCTTWSTPNLSRMGKRMPGRALGQDTRAGADTFSVLAPSTVADPPLSHWERVPYDLSS